MTQGSGILSRYARVLDALAASSTGLTLTEIVQATDLPRGTVHRLIGALREVGYIEPSDGRKIYVLGARLLRMLHLGTPAEAIAPLVRPVLDELVTRFRETAFVAKLIGHEVRSVAMAVPARADQSYVQPGRLMPIHVAASAKAIFAFQDEALVAEVLRAPREKFTDKARTDEDAIRAELARVREGGFAICDEELDPGVFSYACPIHLPGAGVLYSVGVVGITQRLRRFPADEVVAELRRAADAIAAILSAR